MNALNNVVHTVSGWEPRGPSAQSARTEPHPEKSYGLTLNIRATESRRTALAATPRPGTVALVRGQSAMSPWTMSLPSPPPPPPSRDCGGSLPPIMGHDST
jgi:hypothetical protein